MFYVYEYYIVDTGEIFYVGKGTGQRVYDRNHRNDYFKSIWNKYNCSYRIITNNLTNEEAIKLESQRIAELKAIGQARANLSDGQGWPTGEKNPTHKVSHKGVHNQFYGKRHTEESKAKMSASKTGKPGLSGSKNPMYGKGFKGADNPMYGRSGLKHPNKSLFEVYYKNGNVEILLHSEAAKKFGIAFIRVYKTGGYLHYKSNNTLNKTYEGTLILPCNDYPFGE